jgi:proline dehydrogenase
MMAFADVLTEVLEKQDIELIIEEQIKRTNEILNKINEIRAFLEKFPKDSLLYKLFDTHTKDYLQKKYAEIAEFPPEVSKYLEIARKIYTLQQSIIFTKYLER